MAAPPARAFYGRRLRRILPAYYVQLAFLFLVCLPLLRDFSFSAGERGYYAYNLVAHALMLHYTTPVSSGSMGLNGGLWTLAVEADTHEVKNEADIPVWKKHSRDFGSNMTAMAAAIKEKDMAAVKESFTKANQACNDCHAHFRIEATE